MTETTNEAQIAHWNGAGGEPWVLNQERMDRQLAPPGQLALEAAKPAAGEHVFDIGCGTGGTSLELARRVGPGGFVTGLDISAPMLARARERAHGIANVGFVQGDAQTHGFQAAVADLVFSRFGVMFFADPVAAFGNLRRALKSGGRLAFVCWRPVQENAWVAVPLAAAFRHVPRPPPPEPDAPGEFGFADGARVRRILDAVGFSRVAIEPADLPIGAMSVDEAVDTALRIGPVGAALREAPDKRGAVESAVRAALAPHDGPGGVALNAGVWVVRASA